MANCAWRFDNKFGVAYLEDRKLVDRVLDLEGRPTAAKEAVMATYMSEKGKPFAWQVVFEMTDWERIARTLGIKDCEKKPKEEQTVSVTEKMRSRHAAAKPRKS